MAGDGASRGERGWGTGRKGARIARTPSSVPRLSAVILLRDGDEEVARAIGSVGFADEVVLIGSEISGRVEAEARCLGARVVRAGSGASSGWRQVLERPTHDWVLRLESNEEVTPELAIAIRRLLDAGEPRHPAYQIRVVTAFMGRPLSGEGSGARRVRLVGRRRVSETDLSTGGDVVRSASGVLAGAIHRTAFRDVSSAVAAIDSESTLAASGIARSGRRPGPLGLIGGSARQFLRAYIGGQGFRNGSAGLSWAILQAMGAALAVMKAHDLGADAAAGGEPR